MAITEKSVILKASLLSFIDKLGGKTTIFKLRSEYSFEPCAKISTQLFDMQKMKLLVVKKVNGSENEWSITKKAAKFLKDNTDKILEPEKFFELLTAPTNYTRRKSKKKQDINLSTYANSSIKAIVEMEEKSHEIIRFLLNLELMIKSQLDLLIPERQDDQGTTV